MRYATKEQKRKWLRPLMDGEIRSAFLMTEPAVASSDATNIETRIEKDGDHYVINGRKWWSSGVGDPRCKIAILMGKTDPKAAKHQAQSQILVPLDTPGIKVEKMLPVFGYDDAPHGHAQVLLENVRVPKENILLGEGRGFEIAPGAPRVPIGMRRIVLRRSAWWSLLSVDAALGGYGGGSTSGLTALRRRCYAHTDSDVKPPRCVRRATCNPTTEFGSKSMAWE